MSDFLPNQTGWVVEWQDEAGDHEQPFTLDNQVEARALEAQKSRMYREAVKQHQAGEEVFVPKVPGCFPVIGPTPLGFPVKREQEPEVHRPERDTKPKRPYSPTRRR